MEYNIYFTRNKDGSDYSFRYDENNRPLNHLAMYLMDFNSLEENLIGDLLKLKELGNPKINPIFSRTMNGIELTDKRSSKINTCQLDFNERSRIGRLVELYQKS